MKDHPKDSRGPSHDERVENLVYRTWFTALFWGGCAAIALKEFRQASWEDVAGAWSVWGLVTYPLLRWQRHRLVPRVGTLPLWRLIPLFVLPTVAYGMSIRRYFMQKEYDWISLVIPGLLLYVLVAREWFFSIRKERT